MKIEKYVPNEITEREKSIDSVLNAVNFYINKNYFMDLSMQEVLKPNPQDLDIGKMRFFHIDRFVYDKKENINDKMVSVYSAIQELGGTALLVLHSDGSQLQYYIGVRSQNDAALCGAVIQNSLKGNFPGSSITMLSNKNADAVMDRIIGDCSGDSKSCQNISATSVVPTLRNEDKDKYVQGLEKFIDAMQGNEYSAVFLAEPFTKEALEFRKRGLEELASSLSPLQKTTLAYGENYSNAVTEGVYENFSKSVNYSISNTIGTNTGTNSSTTAGKNTGFGIAGFSFGKNKSKTTGVSSGTSWSEATTNGNTDTEGSGTNKGTTVTAGDSHTLTVESVNKTVEVLLKTIDEQLKRIKNCEAYGLWSGAAYFLSPKIQTSVMAANTYKAVVSGDESGVENAYINSWRQVADDDSAKFLPNVLTSIRYGMHPRIISSNLSTNLIDNQIITPGSFISGKEMPLFMGLPQKSVSGLTVSAIAEFGRNIFTLDAVSKNVFQEGENGFLSIGKIFHMGREEQTNVNIDIGSLTSHCLIAGSTGSGKSNTSYVLLNEIHKRNIPFLVIEPAKGEYKSEFVNLPDIHIFSSNHCYGQMLHINPFWFDYKHIHVLEHLDRLVEIFNACWEMYAAMPAILKSAAEQVYIKKGWDILNSEYMGEGEPQYPDFSDLLRVLPEIIKTSGYSSDTQGDYIGALVTRVASLANGITGQIFCSDYFIPDSALFDENTIIDLSRIGSSETKSLITGLLVMKLTEYRTAQATGSNKKLRHVTVLEEAHNLLKRTATAQGQETANLVGKSVEMISNSIAEMRTYGEGFIIIDQSPTAVDISAIKNTNTKIIMRLPEKEDCVTVGNAMALNEDQIKELAKLPTGVAAVIQNNWLETALVKVNRAPQTFSGDYPIVDSKTLANLRGITVSMLLEQYFTNSFNIHEIENTLNSIVCPAYKKTEFLNYANAVINATKASMDMDIFSRGIVDISCCRGILKNYEDQFRYIDTKKLSDEDLSRINIWKSDIEKSVSKILDADKFIIESFIKMLIYDVVVHFGDTRYTDIKDVIYGSKK